MDAQPNALVLQLLEWIAQRPRTYAETMDAWRTSCPRLPIWEEAFDNRLVTVEPNAGAAQSTLLVTVTDRGRTLLDHFTQTKAAS